jgi:hypothetical protein
VLVAGGAGPDRWAALGDRITDVAATGERQCRHVARVWFRQGSQEGLTGGPHYSSSQCGQRDPKRFKNDSNYFK